MLSTSTTGGAASAFFLKGFHDQPHAASVNAQSAASSVPCTWRRAGGVANRRPKWCMQASCAGSAVAGGNVSGCGNEWQSAPGFCGRLFLAMFAM